MSAARFVRRQEAGLACRTGHRNRDDSENGFGVDVRLHAPQGITAIWPLIGSWHRRAGIGLL
jgi:hypothetical protein